MVICRMVCYAQEIIQKRILSHARMGHVMRWGQLGVLPTAYHQQLHMCITDTHVWLQATFLSVEEGALNGHLPNGLLHSGDS